MLKRIIFSFLLVFFVLQNVHAQEEIKVYFPLIIKGNDMPVIIEKWKVISPVASTNYVLNPSAENSGNYSALGLATVTRSSTYQKYGNYSYHVQTYGFGDGISLTLSTLPNENCFVTFRVRGQHNLKAIIGTGLKTPILIEKVDTFWSVYGVQFTALECTGRTELRLIEQGPGDIYIDGIQVENLEYWTSYIDGDQEGCSWNGPDHAATSTRSDKSRSGGQVKNLYSDYGFLVDKVTGVGATSREVGIDEYAILPGGELNEIKIQAREWTIIGKFIADSENEIFSKRRELLKLLRKNPQKEPTKFLFYHPEGIREIKAFYQNGLEGDMSTFYDGWATEDEDKWAKLNKYVEKDSIQLISPNPYFYGQGDKSAALDSNSSMTFRLVASRSKDTGQWSNLGPPNATGIYTSVRALAEDDTYLYIGGDFLNFDNIADADYIVRYHKQNGTYSAMSTGANNIIRCLSIGPDGTLYAGGDFTSIGGVASNRIAKWNGTSWAALGTGFNNTVFSLAIGSTGILYAGGFFTAGGTGGALTHIAQWNGINWSQVGTGVNEFVYAMVIGFDQALYAAGSFTTAGGTSALRIAKWDGSSWSALGTGMNGVAIRALAIGLDGTLYAGGDFTTAGGVSASRIAKWNGYAWFPLGAGVNNYVYSLGVGSDGTLYASGQFTSAGGVSLSDRIAKWDGYAWGHLDIDLPGTSIAYAMIASRYVDPVINQNYDLFLGFDTTGTGSIAGLITATNEGSIDVSPKFIFERNGGTNITLQYVRNESTGKELLFNYTLLDGEKLVIDLTPSKKSCISNFWGNRLDAILVNSNFGDFLLELEDNDISSLTSDNFALYPSSLEAFMQWKETFESYD